MAVLGRGNLKGLHPQVRANAEWALKWADYFGVPVTVTSGFRSWEDQKKLRERYEAGQSAFPANRPGDSAHNFGLAWDSTVPSAYQAWWTEVRRMAGFEVLPNDVIHAQVSNWRAIVRR